MCVMYKIFKLVHKANLFSFFRNVCFYTQSNHFRKQRLFHVRANTRFLYEPANSAEIKMEKFEKESVPWKATTSYSNWSKKEHFEADPFIRVGDFPGFSWRWQSDASVAVDLPLTSTIHQYYLESPIAQLFYLLTIPIQYQILCNYLHMSMYIKLKNN